MQSRTIWHVLVLTGLLVAAFALTIGAALLAAAGDERCVAGRADRERTTEVDRRSRVPDEVDRSLAADDTAAKSKKYLAVQLNAANVDSDRRVDGNGIGASFIYGFPMRRNFQLEARLTGLVLERGEPVGLAHAVRVERAGPTLVLPLARCSGPLELDRVWRAEDRMVQVQPVGLVVHADSYVAAGHRDAVRLDELRAEEADGDEGAQLGRRCVVGVHVALGIPVAMRLTARPHNFTCTILYY